MFTLLSVIIVIVTVISITIIIYTYVRILIIRAINEACTDLSKKKIIKITEISTQALRNYLKLLMEIKININGKKEGYRTAAQFRRHPDARQRAII